MLHRTRIRRHDFTTLPGVSLLCLGLSLLAAPAVQADTIGLADGQALSVLSSPRVALQDDGLNGYLTLGLNHTRTKQKSLVDAVEEPRLSDNSSKVRAFIETGIVYPVKRFRLYAAAGFEDTFSLSLGVRYFVSRTPGES